MPAATQLTRREFLRAGGALAGATAVGLTPLGILGVSGCATLDRGLAALKRDFQGRLLLPGDSGYAYAAWPNNARWADVRPRAVAVCASDEDVQRCITWVQDTNEPFAIRSGGHNYAGFSTTTGLLIDVKTMNGVTLNARAGTATIQGGANNQDVASALRVGNLAIPSGRCPTVGASGLVLGGGWGFSATKSGLTCDSLVATDVVLANSRKVIASEASEPELFWAARGGGGGNFGVHTAFTFKLSEVRDVTTFNIVWPPAKQIELLTALQELQQNHVTMMSTRSKARPQRAGAFPKRDQLVVETLGLFWGNERDLREILAPAYSLLQPQTANIYPMDYWRARDYLLTDDPVGLYDLKSRYVADKLRGDALEDMLNWMTKWPGGSLRQDNMGILFAIGGKVREIKPDATAYVHRNANYIFEMETSWGPIDSPEVVARQQGWLNEYFDAMQRHLLPQSYVNFPNRELKDWAQAYYGSNLPRLSAAKRRYDPGNLFKFAQSIPLSV